MPRANLMHEDYPTTLLIPVLGADDLVDVVLAVLLSEELTRLVQVSSFPQDEIILLCVRWYLRSAHSYRDLEEMMRERGLSIDFMLSAKRDSRAAERFFRKMLKAASHSSPRVINVDKNPAYPLAVEQLKEEGTLPNRTQLRQCTVGRTGEIASIFYRFTKLSTTRDSFNSVSH